MYRRKLEESILPPHCT
jgi:hypothetical protein